MAHAVAGAGRDDLAGTLVAGRYRIEKTVARGGMSVVYRARDVTLDRPIALKVMTPPPEADDPETFVERFDLEADALVRMEHPNIVTLHDRGRTEDGRLFLAMEFIEGPRLSDLVRDSRLSVERSLNLAAQIATALRYAHKRGVVHRDLKPSNLLVRTLDDGAEQIKVVDFGLVKLTERDQGVTRAGLILGSPHCMAPEQIKGGDIDHRADVYALGVLLFRMLTGRYPFHGANSAATMVGHLNSPVPSFREVAADLVVPPGLEDAVRRCLTKSAEERTPDMQAVLDDLSRFLDGPVIDTRTMSRSLRLAADPGPGRPMLVAGIVAAFGLVLLLGVAAVGVWAWPVLSGEPPRPPEAPPPVAAAPVPAAEPPPVVAPPPPEPAPAPALPSPEPVPAAPARPEPPRAAKPPEAPPEPEAPAGYQTLPEEFR